MCLVLSHPSLHMQLNVLSFFLMQVVILCHHRLYIQFLTPRLIWYTSYHSWPRSLRGWKQMIVCGNAKERDFEVDILAWAKLLGINMELFSWQCVRALDINMTCQTSSRCPQTSFLHQSYSNTRSSTPASPPFYQFRCMKSVFYYIKITSRWFFGMWFDRPFVSRSEIVNPCLSSSASEIALSFPAW